jgi:hypothetical protein
MATCGDGLACDHLADAAAGACTAYCDPSKGRMCPLGYDCYVTHVGKPDGPAIQICRLSAGSLGDGGGNAPGDGGLVVPDAHVDSGPNMQ